MILKANVKKRLIKLYSDIIQYACDNAAYVDCDTDCDESYLRDIERFERRFDNLIEALDDESSYKKSKVKKGN